jgi:hypothetical protein
VNRRWYGSFDDGRFNSRSRRSQPRVSRQNAPADAFNKITPELNVSA